jgi:hypothetical protein
MCKDYENFLAENNLTHNQMAAGCLAAIVDETLMEKIYVGHSAIHGLGVFANRDFFTGENIGDVRARSASGECKWTLAGRYTNHAAAPRAFVQKSGEKFLLRALVPIYIGEEITADYRQVKREMEAHV